MAVSEKPWSGFTSADYTPEEYCRASLIDLNESGADKVKGLCKLPIREPSGALNRNALGAAAAVLSGARGGVDAPPAAKKLAARKLIAAYREADMEPPESLTRLAG